MSDTHRHIVTTVEVLVAAVRDASEGAVIGCWGEARPLMRNPESFGATIRNNSLAGVSDIAYYRNSQTGARQGPEEPLAFQAGVHGDLTVENWETRPTNPGGN